MPKLVRNLILVIAALALFLWLLPLPLSHQTSQALLPDGTRLSLEVVRSLPDQARGLSGRAALAENAGMLFVYDETSNPTFWMQGMKFSIDIIWLNQSRVVGINANLPAPNGGAPALYPAPAPVDAVLEVTSGFAAEHELKLGDIINLETR